MMNVQVLKTGAKPGRVYPQCIQCEQIKQGDQREHTLSLKGEPLDILVCSLDNFLGAEVQIECAVGVNKADEGPCRAQI